MNIANNALNEIVGIFSEGHVDGGSFSSNFVRNTKNNIFEIPYVAGNYIEGGIELQGPDPMVLFKDNIIKCDKQIPIVNGMATFEGNYIKLHSHIYIKNNSRILFYNNTIEAPSDVTAIIMQTAHLSSYPNDGEIVGNVFVGTLKGYSNWSGNGVYEVHSNTYAAAKTSGTTAQRPVGLDHSHMGFMFYDTTIWRPVWWIGTKWDDPLDPTKTSES